MGEEMKTIDSLNIEYMLYKIELIMNSFDRINEPEFSKRLEDAKKKLNNVLQKLNKGKNIQSPEIQRELESVSSIVLEAINNMENIEQIKNITN